MSSPRSGSPATRSTTDPAGAGQGAQLPLPRRRAPEPRGLDASTRCWRASSAAHPRRVAVSRRAAWRGSSLGKPRLRAARLPAHALVHARAAFVVQGEIAGQIEVYYTEAMPARGRGAVPAEERKLARRGRRAARPLPRPAGAPARARAGRRRAGAAVPDWWVILDFLRQTDRALLGAPRPQDDQLPLLERRRGGRAPPARDGARPRPGDEDALDDNRPQPRTASGRRPGDDRGRLPHRRPAPARGRDPRLHPELDQGGQVHLPQERARANGHAARRAGRRPPALPPGRRRGEGPLDRHPDRAARRPRAALPHRPARVRQHRQGRTSRSRTSTSSPSASSTRPGATAGSAARRRASSSPRRSWPARPSTATCSGTSASRAAGTSPPTGSSTSSSTTTSRTSTTASTWTPTACGSSTRTSSSCSRTRSSPPRSCAASRPCSTTSRGGRSSCAARACSRTASARRSPGKYKSLFLANPGSQARAAGRAQRRHRRGLRVGVQPRPDRVPRDAGPPRPARGDGHPDPGGGRHAGRAVLAAGLRRGRLLATTSSAGRRGSAREDGLLRIVPGLGTRAVDRLADDYPVLVAPGQPGLRVNQTPDEALRYSPKKVDVINLETGDFETVDVRRAARAARRGAAAGAPDGLDRRPRPPAAAGGARGLRPGRRLVITFEGLLADTPFVTRMRALLQVLREKLKTPVDIEFASRRRERLPAAVPAAGRHRGRGPGADPARPARRSACCSPPTATSRTARCATSPTSSTSTPRRYAAARARPDPRGRPRGRPAEPAAAQAPVRPDGPGPLGQPGRHPPRRARHLLRHQQHGGADRDRPQEGRLRPRPLLRHPLLPGPRRVEHPLPAALPRRPRGRLQRGLLPARAERARRACPGVRAALATSCA